MFQPQSAPALGLHWLCPCCARSRRLVLSALGFVPAVHPWHGSQTKTFPQGPLRPVPFSSPTSPPTSVPPSGQTCACGSSRTPGTLLPQGPSFLLSGTFPLHRPLSPPFPSLPGEEILTILFKITVTPYFFCLLPLLYFSTVT